MNTKLMAIERRGEKRKKTYCRLGPRSWRGVQSWTSGRGDADDNRLYGLYRVVTEILVH